MALTGLKWKRKHGLFKVLYNNASNGRFVYSHSVDFTLSSIYLPTTNLLVSPFTQASTQRYRNSNHPG